MRRMSSLLVWILAVMPAAQPAAQAGELASLLPADTLVYVEWPGTPALRRDLQQSALMRLIEDPQVGPWLENLFPKLADRVRAGIGGPGGANSGELLSDWAGLALEYPCEAVILGISARARGLELDAGLVVRAGRDNSALAEIIDEWMEVLGVVEADITEVRTSGAVVRRTSLPHSGMLLHWGVIDDGFVLAIGPRLIELLLPSGRPEEGVEPDGEQADATDAQETFDADVAAAGEHGYRADSGRDDHRLPGDSSTPSPGRVSSAAAAAVSGGLAAEPAFAEVRRQSGRSAPCVVVYVRLEGLRKLAGALGKLAGLFGGTPGELAKTLSLAQALVPQGATSAAVMLEARREGLLTTSFQPAVAEPEPPGSRFRRPLEPLDLSAIPQGVRWAVAGREDLVERFARLMDLLHEIDPGREQELLRLVERFEEQNGAAFDEQVLAGLGETWLLFDSRCFSRPWSGGLTLVLETRRGYRMAETLRRLAESILEQGAERAESPVRTLNHRGTEVYYLPGAGSGRMPAPAWAECDGRLVLGPYPQTVRSYLDHLITRSTSLLDEPAFARGLNMLPPGSDMIGYIDSAEVVHAACSDVLQGIWKAAVSSDGGPGAWPSPDALASPLFPTIFARARTDRGFVSASFGPLPLPTGLITAGGAAVLARVLLPSATVSGPDDRVGKAAVARSMIGPGGPVVIAIELFFAHMGRYPRDLSELVQAPRDAVSARRWRGPYIRSADHLRDPWGRPLAYAASGGHNGRAFDLWSLGADGENGTEDDIRFETRVSGRQEYARPER